uniref:F-box domain-containing protein n=1 Tax=Panagrolaimus sp. JU765 TaxID=591449 RepID=A0AC34QMB5_9BILA
MTDYFDFIHLPTVVQELVVEEIVHNSIPENRIQFALTCMDFNDMVKRAKPKKILPHLTSFGCEFLISHDHHAGGRFHSPPKLLEILKKVQVERLTVPTRFGLPEEYRSISVEFMDILFKACEFVTKLSVQSGVNDYTQIIDVYKKLKHVNHLDIGKHYSLIDLLPYFPPNMSIFGINPGSIFYLLKLARKSHIYPFVSCSIVGFMAPDDIQQFLKVARFQKNGKGHFEIQTSDHKILSVHMTYLGDDLFKFEALPFDAVSIIVAQKFDENMKRHLSLVMWKRFPNMLIPSVRFNVTSSSSPDQPLFHGELNDHEEKEIIIDNVDPNDWIKVNSEDERFFVLYSKQMMESTFPKNETESLTDYYDKLHKIMDTQIFIFKAGMFTEIIDNYVKNNEVRFI